GKADPHRMFDAELAQAGDPLQDRLGIEAELGDDVDRHAGGLRRLDLVGERTVEVLLGYARMAVRIGGDGDTGDAVTLQRAAVDPLDRAAEVAGGFVVIARDHQHARYGRLAPEAGEKSSSSRAVAKPRTARCGTGSKPALRSRAAASIASCAGRRGTALT